MLSRKSLDKFKQIYFEEFHIKLTDEEATKQATDLLNLMKILTRPDSKEVNKDK